jgi:hypothetical protein
MADVNSPLPAKQEPPGRQSGDREPLTDAQRDFAELLGRILAQLWTEEQRAKIKND